MLCQRKETLKNQQKKQIKKSLISENYQPILEVTGFLKGKIPPLFQLQGFSKIKYFQETTLPTHHEENDNGQNSFDCCILFI